MSLLRIPLNFSPERSGLVRRSRLQRKHVGDLDACMPYILSGYSHGPGQIQDAEGLQDLQTPGLKEGRSVKLGLRRRRCSASRVFAEDTSAALRHPARPSSDAERLNMPMVMRGRHRGDEADHAKHLDGDGEDNTFSMIRAGAGQGRTLKGHGEQLDGERVEVQVDAGQ
jgi:hypothetical protein